MQTEEKYLPPQARFQCYYPGFLQVGLYGAPSMSCYTCNLSLHPRARDHMLREGMFGRLHLDLKGRPLFIYTPFLHVPHCEDLPPDILSGCIKEIREMMLLVANTVNYQVMFSYGNWLHHKDHQHFKIKIDEKTFDSLKQDHFSRIFRAPVADISTRRPPSDADKASSWRRHADIK